MIYSILQIKAFNNNYTIRILKCQQKATLFFVFICGFVCVFMWFLLFFTYFFILFSIFPVDRISPLCHTETIQSISSDGDIAL